MLAEKLDILPRTLHVCHGLLLSVHVHCKLFDTTDMSTSQSQDVSHVDEHDYPRKLDSVARVTHEKMNVPRGHLYRKNGEHGVHRFSLGSKIMSTRAKNFRSCSQ